jgi:hypothetical protein
MEYDAADDLLITLLPRTGGRPYAFGAGVLSPVTRRVEHYCCESADNSTNFPLVLDSPSAFLRNFTGGGGGMLDGKFCQKCKMEKT